MRLRRDRLFAWAEIAFGRMFDAITPVWMAFVAVLFVGSLVAIAVDIISLLT